MSIISDGAGGVYTEYEADNQPTITTDPVPVPDGEAAYIGFTYDPETHDLQTGVTDLTDPNNPVTSVSNPVDANLPHPLSVDTVTVGSVHNSGDMLVYVDNLVIVNTSSGENDFEQQSGGYGDEGRDNVVGFATFDDATTGDTGSGTGTGTGSGTDTGSGSGTGSGTPTMTVITEGPFKLI